MSNWWANKIGGTAPPRASGPLAPGPPPGLDHSNLIEGYLDRRSAPTGPPVPLEQLPLEQYEPPDPGDPYGHKKNWFKWRGDPRGGASETERCPNCGDARYFSRATVETGKMNRDGIMVYPAPECAACGYPRQQGAVNAPVKVLGGSAIGSRQAEAPAPPGSLASLRSQR